MGSTKQLFSEQLHELIAQTTTNLTRVQRTKFETLITIHVHQHDIFEELVSGFSTSCPAVSLVRAALQDLVNFIGSCYSTGSCQFHSD